MEFPTEILIESQWVIYGLENCVICNIDQMKDNTVFGQNNQMLDNWVSGR